MPTSAALEKKAALIFAPIKDFAYLCTRFAKGQALAAKKRLFFIRFRSFSSVGLERMLDRHEVTGSNPVMTTTFLLPIEGESSGSLPRQPWFSGCSAVR
jgi:hypothetical protein